MRRWKNNTIKGPSKTKNTSAKGIKKGFLFKIDGRNLEQDLDDIDITHVIWNYKIDKRHFGTYLANLTFSVLNIVITKIKL